MQRIDPDITPADFGNIRQSHLESIRDVCLARDSYLRGLDLLIGAENRGEVIPIAKNELSTAGFSRKARERLFHLSCEELKDLAAKCPVNSFLWDAYVTELQNLLSEMDRLRKKEQSIGRPPFMGRPYIIPQQADVLAKLTILRWHEEVGTNTIGSFDLRELLTGYAGGDIVAFGLKFEEPAIEFGERAVGIVAARRFLELYRNELLMPPALKRKSNVDEYTRHVVETDDLNWMDDGGKQLMEDLCDMMQDKISDVLPDFMSVADWFIQSLPTMDNNQLKRGWAYLEERSREWHELEIYLRYIAMIKGNPKWPCAIADNLDSWHQRHPEFGMLTLYPLVSFKALKQESQRMHNCVVSHVVECLAGKTRIFSVGGNSNGKRIATFEINLSQRGWSVTEMKGSRNQELIGCLSSNSAPLAPLARAVIEWYDKFAPDGYQDITAGCM